MPGIARQFEPQITRTGGAPSKYRFTARCSRCPKTDTYEAGRPAGDELVKGYSKSAAGFWDVTGPTICVRIAWRNPERLSSLGCPMTQSPRGLQRRPTLQVA